MNITTKDWKKFSDEVDAHNERIHEAARKEYEERKAKKKQEDRELELKRRTDEAEARAELEALYRKEPQKYKGIFPTITQEWSDWSIKVMAKKTKLSMCQTIPSWYGYTLMPPVFIGGVKKTIINFYEWKAGKLKLKE